MLEVRKVFDLVESAVVHLQFVAAPIGNAPRTAVEQALVATERVVHELQLSGETRTRNHLKAWSRYTKPTCDLYAFFGQNWKSKIGSLSL